MLNALPASRPSRRLATLLLAVFAAASVAGFSPVPASAQSQTLVPSVQTKEEAKQAQEAADQAAADNSGGSIPLIGWFGIVALVVIGGATFYMLRDSRSLVGDTTDRRAAPTRPLTPSTTRGAPKGMFDGEGSPGGQTRRSKNRAKAKRQKQARRANRPR